MCGQQRARRVPTHAVQQNRCVVRSPVGAQQYRRWNCDADRSGSLEIYNELKFGWLFDGQISRLGAAENFINVGGRPPETSGNTRAIGDETAALRDLLLRKKRGQVRRGCECHDARVLTIE